jgi:hypothetical protein
MPTISMFYGIIVRMYYFDNQKHQSPHIHVYYQDSEAVIGIREGVVLEGSLPKPKQKLVDAWVEIHKDELMADWNLLLTANQFLK